MNGKEGTIVGVEVHPLKVISDSRGAVLHMMGRDAAWFRNFGEIYFSEVKPGVAKGWKMHHKMTQHVVVPVGRVRFVLKDGRQGTGTDERRVTVELGRPDAYSLLVIPPGIWYSFEGLGTVPSLIANCTDLVHDLEEVVRGDDPR